MGKTIVITSRGAGQSLTGSSTVYFPVTQSSSNNVVTSLEIAVKGSFLGAGTLSSMQIVLTASSGTTKTFTFRKNETDGNQTVAIGASLTGNFTDAVNTDTIASGDDLTTRLASGPTATLILISYVFEGASSVTSTFFGCSESLSTSSATRYFPLVGGNFSPITTETNIRYKAKTAGTLSGLGITIRSNPRSTTTTYKSRVNSTNGSCSLAVSASATGVFEDGSGSDSIAVDDLLNLTVINGSSTGSLEIVSVIKFTGGSTYTPMLNSNASTLAVSAGATAYFTVGGDLGTNATDASTKSNAKFAAEFSKLSCYIATNTVSNSSTLRFRKNGSNGNQAVSFAAAATGFFEDASNTDAVAISDDTNYQIVAGSGGTSITFGSVASLIKEQAGTEYTSTLTDAVSIVETFSKRAGKTFLDTATIAERFVRTISRRLQDTTTIVAVALTRAGKAFLETITMSETFLALRVATINLLDTAVIVEQFNRAVTRLFQDTVTMVEFFGKTIARAFMDGVAIAERIVRAISRVFEDTVTIVERFVRTMARSLEDTVTMNEVFDYFHSKIRSFVDHITVTSRFGVFLNGLQSGIWALIARTTGAWTGIARVATDVWTKTARTISDWTKIDRQ